MSHRLYFSAHWCPPCRRFTPRLAEAYEAHGAHLRRGDDETNEDTVGGDGTDDDDGDAVGEIEVIFVSLDSVRSEFDAYRGAMPWLAVPFGHLHKLRIKDQLSEKYGVRGIPDLIVLDGTSGEVVERNGRGEYATYFKGGTASGGCVVS